MTTTQLAMTTKQLAMTKLPLLAAQESTLDGTAATSPTTTIHAVDDVTVVLTVAVDGARLARSVAIQWHHAREKTGTPATEDEGATTITYNFVADRPGTFTYHARYSRDRNRAGGLVDVRGSEACPSAGRRARTDAVSLPRRDDGSAAGCRARTAGGRGVANVPRSDRGPPSADGRASRPASTAVRLRRADWSAWWGRGMASVEAQLMADCPVIEYDGAQYDGGPPVQRVLRWGGATLAAAALWVSGVCGSRDPD